MEMKKINEHCDRVTDLLIQTTELNGLLSLSLNKTKKRRRNQPHF